jgi:hypothetical protein
MQNSVFSCAKTGDEAGMAHSGAMELVFQCVSHVMSCCVVLPRVQEA